MVTGLLIASLKDARAKAVRLARSAREAHEGLVNKDAGYAREILAVAEAHEEAAAVYRRHLERATNTNGDAQ